MRTMAFVNSVSSLIWSVAPLLVTLITFTGSFLTLECMSFVIGLSKTWLSLYISWRSKYIGCTKNFQMSYFVQYYEISDDHASKCYQLGTKSTSFTQARFQSNLSIIKFSSLVPLKKRRFKCENLLEAYWKIFAFAGAWRKWLQKRIKIMDSDRKWVFQLGWW